MNSVRRSGCVLFKLCRGAVSTVRPVRQRVRSLSGLSVFTHLDRTEIRPAHLNRIELRLRDFQGLHSDTHTSPGEHTDGETHSTAQTTPPEQQQQGPHVFNLDVLVSLLRQENAEDICVIKVPVELKYTDFFIVVSGSSTRHLRAMALYAIKVYKFMKRDFDPHVHIEGKDAEDWMCIDFGSMVVHFMLPETRERYELEKLWTLRFFDEQFCSIPTQTLPEDFIYDAETK